MVFNRGIILTENKMIFLSAFADEVSQDIREQIKFSIQLFEENEHLLISAENNIKDAKAHLAHLVLQLKNLADYTEAPEYHLLLKIRALSTSRNTLYPRLSRQMLSSAWCAR